MISDGRQGEKGCKIYKSFTEEITASVLLPVIWGRKILPLRAGCKKLWSSSKQMLKQNK